MRQSSFTLMLILLVLNACSDHPFNQYPAENVDFNKIFSDSVRTIGAVNAAYSKLTYCGKYFRLGNAMQASVTDEAKHATSSTTAAVDNFVNGRWDANNIPDAGWNDMYEGIRHCNLFLPYWENDRSRLPISDGAYNRTLGEFLFLRAFYHFELFKRYGGIPILTKVLNPGDDMQIGRETYANTVKFIVEQCDRAASLLPKNYASYTSYYGKATSGAALALKSRVLLYAASPLVNAEKDYVDGTNELVWMGGYDNERWKDAAQAAYNVIDLNEYQLYDYLPEGNGTYSFEYFNDSYYTTNREFIFGRLWVQDNTMETNNAPMGYQNAGGITCPTQDFVDAFLMSDGQPFDWNNPDQAANPYENRDPRLSLYVFYNGEKWWYTDNREYDSKKTYGLIETFVGSADDATTLTDGVRTGYYLRKFSSRDASIFGTIYNASHNFGFFRYAETVLNFAEAANEYGGPTYAINGYDARMAINSIRTRAQMPSVDNDVTQNELRELIRLERRIELAFEEHRFWDIRRWKIGTTLKKSIDGMKIIKNPDDSYTYNRQVGIEARVFESKHYFYPIPQTEINRNPKLEQNPEW
ncbi:MAG: RagB/SusD family nutrient uptake outer membrane protein [Bacteroidia bacterium]|nr:RagB/SusD family nutrient uptake outer membrane protein [Bacteroidia bacterium]